MKKALVLMFAAVLAASTVWAADTASYAEMKKIKQAQREAREAQKSGSVQKPESKWAKFWKNEGERSGLGVSSSGASNVMAKLNPVPFFKSQKEQYDARKASAGK